MNTKLARINIVGLHKKYGKHVIFNNTNLSITSEHVNLLRAPNGFGKSTLIKCIVGITKYQGQIIINFDKFAYCPEKFSFPEFITIKELLALLPLDIHSAETLLEKFKIRMPLKVSELSKGMHQKILLTLIICRDVDAYFFDEPLNGLDDESIAIFVEALKELHKKGKLLLISTHNPQFFQALKCRIIVLRDYL